MYCADYRDGGVLIQDINPAFKDVGYVAEGTWDAEVVEELKPEPGDIVVEKSRYSGFHGSRLEPVLRSLGAETLVMCGVGTHHCVECTARDAHMRDYRVFIARDATGEANQTWKEASLAAFEQGFRLGRRRRGCRRRLERVRLRRGEEDTAMQRARVGDVEIAFERHGEGPAVMLVSGLGGVGSYWNPQIEAFSRSFTVITHDHRGTGQSTRFEGEYSVDMLAADALGLMDELGIERSHFVGHSTGGAIAQTLAIEHPQRVASMVQYASWTKADGHVRLCFFVRRRLLLGWGIAVHLPMSGRHRCSSCPTGGSATMRRRSNRLRPTLLTAFRV